MKLKTGGRGGARDIFPCKKKKEGEKEKFVSLFVSPPLITGF